MQRASFIVGLALLLLPACSRAPLVPDAGGDALDASTDTSSIDASTDTNAIDASQDTAMMDAPDAGGESPIAGDAGVPRHDGGRDAPTFDAPPFDAAGVPERCGGGTVCRDPGAFCDFTELGCDGATGFCMPRPMLCTFVAMEVCGCDGVSYLNECWANQAGTDTFTLGSCASRGDASVRDAGAPLPP